LRVVHDTPGRRLTLEGDPGKLSWGVVLILVVVLGPFLTIPVGIVFVILQGGDRVSLLIGGFVALIFLSIAGASLARLLRGARRASRLDVNRGAGEIRIGMTAVLGGSTKEVVVPIPRLRSATLRRSASTELRPGKASALLLELRTRREGENTALDTHAVDFGVEGLDRHDEVADLAMRLGAAAGLPFMHVVRNDARDVEVELSKEPRPGFTQIPSGLGSADYAQDAVAPAAQSAVAREKVAPFDPASFRSAHRIETWTPGVQVRMRKPWSLAHFGCLPFTLFVLLGPAAFFGLEIPELLPRLIVTFMATIFGLIFGAIAIAVVWDAFPKLVDIDWGTRKVTLKTLRRSLEIPFEALSGIEFKAVHSVSRGKNSTTHSYHCEIRALLRAGGVETSEELVRTSRFQSNPDEPYRMALPLATELAKALRLERRFTNYD
jgi:hypothetical protein